MDVYTLSNTGAFGEHGPTTVGLSGHKSIPLYGNIEAFRFAFDVVYTNVMSAGAYRGYGATQGIFCSRVGSGRAGGEDGCLCNGTSGEESCERRADHAGIL